MDRTVEAEKAEIEIGIVQKIDEAAPLVIVKSAVTNCCHKL